MKYPKYVYKRISGQEYYCGVSDSVIENMLYERKGAIGIKNLEDAAVKRVQALKISGCSILEINQRTGFEVGLVKEILKEVTDGST